MSDIELTAVKRNDVKHSDYVVRPICHFRPMILSELYDATVYTCTYCKCEVYEENGKWFKITIDGNLLTKR